MKKSRIKKPKIKCVIFDLGDVLVHNNPARACRKLSHNCALSHDEVAWFASKSVHQQLDTGHISNRSLYKIAVKNLKLKISQKKFEQVFTDIFTNNVPVQTLARKLAKNYKLLLLSNTNSIHFNHIKKNFPVIKLFKSLILSYKVRSMKPSLPIYKIAIKKSGFDANNCVFVDDRKENIIAARKTGLKAVHYIGISKLRTDLRKLGVKF